MEEVDDCDLMVQRVAALDLGKAGLEACVRVLHPQRPGRRMQELRGYGATTAQLLKMAAWLRHWQAQRVVMDSTSTYWKGNLRRPSASASLIAVVARAGCVMATRLALLRPRPGRAGRMSAPSGRLPPPPAHLGAARLCHRRLAAECRAPAPELGGRRHEPARIRYGLALESVRRITDFHSATGVGPVDWPVSLLHDVGEFMGDHVPAGIGGRVVSSWRMRTSLKSWPNPAFHVGPQAGFQRGTDKSHHVVHRGAFFFQQGCRSRVSSGALKPN
jgi:hypothetical protein